MREPAAVRGERPDRGVARTVTTTPCGDDDCRAPYCICDHPDDCPCGGCIEALDLGSDDQDNHDDDTQWCDDLACVDCYGEPCPVDCACAWCTGEHNDLPGIVTVHANPAYL